ncbi:FAD:protein FMN transferase [Frigidibacter sp. RF13]|uniref:FAD:protein FMN transferase n=1 Tax=Frigidibacter sp. RF13 TaxID=2997340 RepID=UPI00226F050F|nr:FAD:protein FMN transferase [Frigidibacter sp. RF13]MCY1128285.1 FAD:protein FMN transferase [Frigidibacter sp. RF13]
MQTRRRFLAITAAAPFALAGATRAALSPTWTGVALGARASLRIDHPDAARIAEEVTSEIARLEDIFSLYRPDSALVRLNRTGRIDAPPPELLECLTLAGAVHRASGGRFDPTIQPLWALWAERAATGARPTPPELEAARALGGWAELRLDSSAVTLAPGMALTLNGIAQGYVADRVAALMEGQGLTDILIDTGEIRALGGQPNGGDWPVQLAEGGLVPLRQRALATSAPLGTTFDADGRSGHILDPMTGEAAPHVWRAVSISAPSAALADALSTAACLIKVKADIDAILSSFPEARFEAAVTL